MKNKANYFIVIVLCVSIMFLSVGFSALSNNDRIAAGAFVKAENDIRIVGLVSKSVGNGGLLTYSEYTKKNIDIGLELPESDSYVILETNIMNLGNKEMGIRNIIGVNDNLKVEIVNNQFLSDGYQDYTFKQMLCDDNNKQCHSGSTTKVLVKISYKDLAAYENSENHFFPINAEYDFRNMYKITAGAEFEKRISSGYVTYVIEGDPLDIKMKSDVYNTAENIHVTQGMDDLVIDTDYTYLDNQLSIPSVMDNIKLGYHTVSYGSVSLGNEWIDDYTVEITLNGTLSQNLYIRIVRGDVYISNNGTLICDGDYSEKAIFYEGDTIYQEFIPISGTAQLTSAFTSKFRSTDGKCTALDQAQLIAKHSKQNFDINSYGRNEYKLTQNVGQLSIYSSAGNIFNNFKFRIHYGKIS